MPQDHGIAFASIASLLFGDVPRCFSRDARIGMDIDAADV